MQALNLKPFFSASNLLGSRPGSVGVGVSGCPGAAWVFNRRAPRAAYTLALVFPGVSAVVPGSVSHIPTLFTGVSVTTRVHRGRCVVRVRGSVSTLRAVASWWSLSFFGTSPASAGVVGQGS